jgi:hypothetical protein
MFYLNNQKMYLLVNWAQTKTPEIMNIYCRGKTVLLQS